MGIRGRHSAAELAVILPNGVSQIVRHKPPAELSEDEAVEWRALMNVLSPDEYPVDCHPAFVQLCRHTVNARRLAELKQRMIEAKDTDRVLEVLRHEELQTRIITSVMTKLRLTPQSRYDRTKKRATGTKKPWHTEEEADER